MDARRGRFRKVVTNKGGLNGTTRYIWGGQPFGWQCLEELASDDDIVARYTYAPGYIDAVAVQERDLSSDNDFADDDEVVYYHSSTLFSVYALSDASESVIERYRYDAYGPCTVLDADGSVDGDGLSDVKNPYTFTARRLDAESGLMQYRFRDYNPALGRFVQRDAIEHHGSLNLYEYVLGGPTVGLDPRGLDVVFENEYGRFTVESCFALDGGISMGTTSYWLTSVLNLMLMLYAAMKSHRSQSTGRLSNEATSGGGLGGAGLGGKDTHARAGLCGISSVSLGIRGRGTGRSVFPECRPTREERPGST